VDRESAIHAAGIRITAMQNRLLPLVYKIRIPRRHAGITLSHLANQKILRSQLPGAPKFRLVSNSLPASGIASIAGIHRYLAYNAAHTRVHPQTRRAMPIRGCDAWTRRDATRQRNRLSWHDRERSILAWWYLFISRTTARDKRVTSMKFHARTGYRTAVALRSIARYSTRDNAFPRACTCPRASEEARAPIDDGFARSHSFFFFFPSTLQKHFNLREMRELLFGTRSQLLSFD